MTEAAVSALEKARDRYKAYIQPVDIVKKNDKNDKNEKRTGDLSHNETHLIATSVEEDLNRNVAKKIESIDVDKKISKIADSENNEHAPMPSDHSDLFLNFDSKMSQIRRSLRAIAEQDGVSFNNTTSSTLELSSDSILQAFQKDSEKVIESHKVLDRDTTEQVKRSVESIVEENAKALREIATEYIPESIDSFASLEARSESRDIKFDRLKTMLQY